MNVVVEQRNLSGLNLNEKTMEAEGDKDTDRLPQQRQL